ncbi:MAG: OadG family protein, partial [Candidatus Methanoperedens sp.]|nr:OadG family protein [Candidatus Methanoperedens sp.]
MRNNPRPGVISSLIALMFILSLFSGVVAAQSPEEKMDKDKEQYALYKNNYENTKKKFENAKDAFENARNRLKK